MLISKIKDALSQNDIIKARSIIISRLDIDRFSEVMETVTFRNEIPTQLFVQDDGKFQFLSQEHWNFKYWLNVRVQMRGNFSEKKLDHILEVMKFLREQKDSDFTPTATSKDSTSQGTFSGKRTTVVCSTTGIGAVAGMLVSGSGIGKAIGGAVLGGGLGLLAGLGYLYYSSNKK